MITRKQLAEGARLAHTIGISSTISLTQLASLHQTVSCTYELNPRFYSVLSLHLLSDACRELPHARHGCPAAFLIKPARQRLLVVFCSSMILSRVRQVSTSTVMGKRTVLYRLRLEPFH